MATLFEVKENPGSFEPGLSKVLLSAHQAGGNLSVP